jgi:uncharacterized protein DUF5677
MVRADKTVLNALKGLPNKFLEKLIADKLQKAGVADAEKLASMLLAHELSDSTDKFIWDDGSEEARPDVNIEISAQDLDEVEQKIGAFLQNDLPKVVDKTVREAAKGASCDLKKKWPEVDDWHENTMAIFRYNLDARWGKALDRLRMLLAASREIGEERFKRYRRLKRHKQPVLWEVLFRLHARACQVTEEIILLLESGFADGAMARWRTLHEISVVATVLADRGEEIAKRYVAHEVVEAKSAMDEYERSWLPLGYPPISDRRKKHLLASYKEVIEVFGKPFGSIYGWAAHHLKRSKPTFSDLEEAAGRAQTRPYYKMASYNVHASPRGIYDRLGYDAQRMIIAGATNAGLTEPGQNTAFSLTLITHFLYREPHTMPDLISLRMLADLRDEIPPLFARAESKLNRDEAKIQKVIKQKKSTLKVKRKVALSKPGL